VTERQKDDIKNRNQGFNEKYPNVSKEKGRIRAWQVNLRAINQGIDDLESLPIESEYHKRIRQPGGG